VDGKVAFYNAGNHWFQAGIKDVGNDKLKECHWLYVLPGIIIPLGALMDALQNERKVKG
jgi:hypothetical protein